VHFILFEYILYSPLHYPPPLLQVAKSFKVAVAQSSPTLVPGRGAPRTASSSSSEVRWLRAGMEAPQVVVEPHRATPLAHAYE
jgi:hypothetical protein